MRLKHLLSILILCLGSKAFAISDNTAYAIILFLPGFVTGAVFAGNITADARKEKYIKYKTKGMFASLGASIQFWRLSIGFRGVLYKGLLADALAPESVDTVVFANKFQWTHHLKS